MKNTLLLLGLFGGLASGNTLSLYDQWTFDSDLTSTTRSLTFSEQGVTSKTFNNDGTVSIVLPGGTYGIYLTDGLGLTSNWALQITLQAPVNSSATAQNLIGLDNNTDGQGTAISLANSTDGGVYAFASGGNFGSWGTATRTNLAQVGSMTTLTIVNYNDQLYFAQGTNWAKFNNATSDSIDIGNKDLNKLLVGFGPGGNAGINGTIILDEISVYTFDSSTTSLADVKSALVPEPTTATLSLLALAGLVARRRR